MTNSTNASLQWEVAGGKKITTRKVNTELNGAKLTNGKQTVNGKQDFISKIPKLATSPPLKTESSMYDLIRESDDDSDYEARKKQEQKAAKKPTGSAPVSPKQKQQQQPQEQPLNLLKTSIISSQKKSPKPTASPRRVESELETALSQLSFENVQNEYMKLEKLFPDNQATIVYNLAMFVNQTLNHIPDIEPTHGNEPYLTKLDKKCEKFFNNLLNRLKKADSDSVFDQCFGLIFADNPRVFSHHGIILFVQLLLRQNPNLLVFSFTKCIDLINSSRHRHQRVLIALRSLSQIGYSSLSDGIRIWFDVMLPLISTKGLTNYIATYLSALFEYHKSSIAKQTNIQSLIDCDQYLDFYDMVNDKSFVLSKDAQTKFKSSFQQIRNIFFQNLSDSEYFEPILSNLVNESTPKQSELLEILSRIVMANRDALTKWRKIYYKTLLQSTIFLEHLSKTQSLKGLKEIRETLKYFEYHTNVQLAQMTPTNNVNNKDAGKHHYYKKSQKSSSSLIESERLRAFNKLVKQLIKQNFQRTSFLSMAFRSFIIFALIVGGFFYWDINQNKSVYVNSIQSELKKHGLLEPTLKVVDTANNYYLNARKWVLTNVPIWYHQTMVVVVPLANQVKNQTVEYSELAWNKSEPYRELAIVYYEQSKQYIQTNFPIFVENLFKFTNTVIENVEIGCNLFMVYFNQAKDVVESKMGMSHGELDRIFLDAIKIVSEKINVGVQWFNENLTKVY